jgi:hypothetical protein
MERICKAKTAYVGDGESSGAVEVKPRCEGAVALPVISWMAAVVGVAIVVSIAGSGTERCATTTAFPHRGQKLALAGMGVPHLPQNIMGVSVLRHHVVLANFVQPVQKLSTRTQELCAFRTDACGFEWSCRYEKEQARYKHPDAKPNEYADDSIIVYVNPQN